MDHDEATESEGQVRQSVVEDNSRLRGSSIKPTSEFMPDGDDESSCDDELAFGQDEGHDSMEVARIEVGEGHGSMEVDAASIESFGITASSDGGTSSGVVVEGVGNLNDSFNDVDGAEESRREEHPSPCETDAVLNGMDPDKTLSSASQANGKPAVSDVAIRAVEASGANNLIPQLLSDNLGMYSEAQISFGHGHEMSVDDDDDDDEILSDKASIADFLSDSDALISGQFSADRAPLENAYGPFIHPTDTCLADARERLHVALEQTRLLGASFTDQAYERYRCLMKPVHESLEEIIEPILIDPHRALDSLKEELDSIKAEKDTEKKQALQAGVGVEELAYFGEGLHLVLLPEDEVDETEMDITQYPDRGPTNPETGEHVEEISAAAASATEQVFDRIRRIRAIRMGVDNMELGIQQISTTQLTRNIAKDHRTSDKSISSSFAPASFSSASPALSVNINSGDIHPNSTKGSLQHLLTLAPDAEGARSDGNLTAVQSALIARGVGMHEMKRDPRINPLRQRMVQQNYFSPMPSYKFLPPLLGPHQIYRSQASVRRERHRVQSGARESIESVVEGICSSFVNRRVETVGTHEKDYDKRIVDSTSIGRCGISGGINKALFDERSALEFDLLWRIHGEMLKSQRIEDARSASHGITEITDPGCESLRSSPNNYDFDPLLAFSVMNAVGLVRRKDGNSNYQQLASGRKTENACAQTLGLENLASLPSVNAFLRKISSNNNGKNRLLSDNGDVVTETNKMKSDTSDTRNGDNNEDIHVIRGGGGQDEASPIESKTRSKEISEKESGVSKVTTSTNDAPISDPSLAGYAGFGPMYSAMSQVPLGDKQSQNIVSSRQLWQHQLGVSPNLYHTAPSSHQFTGPHLTSLQSDLSDFYLRNSIVGNSDWAALQAANSATRAEFLAQHPQLATSLGIFPGQMNLTFLEQEFAKTMLLRDHQNAAVARAHGSATAAASARHQAIQSSINPQNPFGFQDRSNDMQFISSLSASSATMQQKGEDRKQLHRKRSRSLSEQVVISNKEMKRTETSITVADAKRPASAPPSPLNFDDSNSPAVAPPSTLKFEPNNHTPNGSSKMIGSHDVASIPELNFSLPAPPVGLDEDIADLIAHAKFHEAYSLSQSKSHESELLVEFLLSLGAAIPIPKDFIAIPLVKKMGSPNYQMRMHGFEGSNISATASREVIVAIISIWLWTAYKNCFKQTIVASENDDADLYYKRLINMAIVMSLSALLNFLESHSLNGKNDGQITPLSNEQVAAIASKSLANHVYLDYCADASFPILDDLVKLLDSLRTDALRAKTQERVLLAALVSRCGNMTEAFSNAYVSSIVRAGVALGHENVCEMGQDEMCRASTLLPYDYFHDNFGVWEEPCRPVTGYHAAIGGDELKRRAHARSLIQKSMMRLQNLLGLKGGISDGGPYFPIASPLKISTPPTQAATPSLVKTPSGSLKRRGSYDNLGTPGPGEQDFTFNPDHCVDPILWDPNDVGNLPYGEHEFGGKPVGIFAIGKKSLPGDENPDYQSASLAASYPSTQELEWEDVANMFFHGGSTRSIDINYDFDSQDQLGKKKIFAPFVRAFDFTSINQERETGEEINSDEEICDETILQRHQKGLDEMKLKLDAALESRKQLLQQRGRKR